MAMYRLADITYMPDRVAAHVPLLAGKATPHIGQVEFHFML